MDPSRPLVSFRADRKRRDQKPRVLLSCTLCREKKLKCDRATPCANCRKRHQDSSCRYISERPGEVASRLQYLEQRVLDLEQRTRPGGQQDSTRTASASKTDGFLLSEKNGSRFIDPSHWQAIMNNAVGGLLHETDEPESIPQSPVLLLAISQTMDLAELLAGVPPRPIADLLVFRCLDSREPSLISIHIPTFKTEYLAFWDNPSQVSLAWLALLYGILSCAVYIEHTMNPAVSSQPLPAVFYTYRMNCAVALARSNYALPGRYKVEAAIMYLGIEYLQSHNLKTGISMLLGIVARLAIIMGYHRDHPHSHISTFDSEMRRRAWLLLLVIDSIVSRQEGLPLVIHRGVGDDVTRPRNLLDDDFGPHTTVLPPSRPEDQIDSNITYLLAMQQMLAVASEIAATASVVALSPERTTALTQQLETVHGQIPLIFRMQSMSSSSSALSSSNETVLGRYGLEILYQHTRCILYRQYLVTPRAEEEEEKEEEKKKKKKKKKKKEEEGPDFRGACVDAARQILARQSELFQGVLGTPRNRDRVWFGVSRSVSDGMTAAMVICLEVIQQAANGAVRTELIELLRTSHLSWKRSSRPSLETRKAAEIVGSMLRLLGGGSSSGISSVDTITSGGSVVSSSDAGDEEDLSTITAASSSVERGDDPGLFPSSPIQEMLNGDSALEMFDWALWDREMQQLNGLRGDVMG
ncbi:hypothetical protein FE257_009417 [Aspergillus nanangensis]|uniref:Zn(2)-C6 fungal-type domain-containing protein n=1 Tax=Aspergillus nanangensis TaxID=2582783 RepID=A0AAD4GSU9_ASPNN|nr:hypothetical protein FE257_009417 [Aspergillus nanangensis]